jgi:lysophospholipase L1-like esterase
VLALGDSITNGGGELQWGVALQSWAQWVARSVGLPFTGYAFDGARIEDIVSRQIPAFQTRSAHPDARYELGCLYIGVNDVRGLDWDPPAFERGYDVALTAMNERCDRLLAVTIPLDLGRPRAGDKVPQANAIIERLAAEHGALILDLSGFAGRQHVMADHVHPTALGQIHIAERALEVLASDGVPVLARPSDMISYEVTPYERLRAGMTYAYRRSKIELRGLLFKAGLLRP